MTVRITTGWVTLAVAARIAASDGIGLEALRQLAPQLDGAGVSIAQPEAGDPLWQVNPEVVGQPPLLFLWTSDLGTTNQFPNSLGQESGHANRVAGICYGTTEDLATGIDGVENYEASHFYSVIQSQNPITARLVNQSFVFGEQLSSVDRDYDNYAARYGALFISGVGNSGSPNSPATAYNGIAVGAYNGQSSSGPTSDGRSKPDLTAPASQTSFSTPLVTGSAALLLEAASNGVGGTGTESEAADYRTIKALLLNGADKTGGWTNGSATPLDARYGAGVLNVFRTYHQMRGGLHVSTETTQYNTGLPHDPPPGDAFIPARRGWDLAQLSSTVAKDSANHYYFNITGQTNTLPVLQATLVWARPLNRANINDLDLFLYQADTGEMLASSTSPVDNVEHLFLEDLPLGRYVLQVLKWGGTDKRVTNNETYALAFDFGPPIASRLVNPVYGQSRFQARLEGEPHERYILQTTRDFATWWPVSTNVLPESGFIDLVDDSAVGDPQRFYRAVLAP